MPIFNVLLSPSETTQNTHCIKALQCCRQTLEKIRFSIGLSIACVKRSLSSLKNVVDLKLMGPNDSKTSGTKRWNFNILDYFLEAASSAESKSISDCDIPRYRFAVFATWCVKLPCRLLGGLWLSCLCQSILNKIENVFASQNFPSVFFTWLAMIVSGINHIAVCALVGFTLTDT